MINFKVVNGDNDKWNKRVLDNGDMLEITFEDEVINVFVVRTGWNSLAVIDKEWDTRFDSLTFNNNTTLEELFGLISNSYDSPISIRLFPAEGVKVEVVADASKAIAYDMLIVKE